MQNWIVILTWWWDLPPDIGSLLPIKDCLRVLVVPLATDSFSLEKWGERFGKISSVRFQLIIASGESISAMLELAESADILFIPGWDPIRLMDWLRSDFLFSRLLDLFTGPDKVIIWSSAGSIVFFEKFLYSVESTKDGAASYSDKIHEGFGIVKWIACAHFTNWNRKEALSHYVWEFSKEWYWIDEWAAMILYSDWFLSCAWGNVWRIEPNPISIHSLHRSEHR